MPKTVDILIGVVLVMLIMSMVVTILTQFIAAGWNLRGKALLRGVGDLLALLDRGLTQAQAFQLAAFLLRDPLISAPGLRGWRTLAGSVHREELTKLILEFAANAPPEQPRWVTFIRAIAQKMPWLRQVGAQFPRLRNLIPTQAALAVLHVRVNASLAGNGIQDPAAVLKDIRRAALELEKTNPELSNNARVNMAILHFASSDYVGKLNAWFDQSMDRVSDLFTFKIRRVTIVVAAVVTLAVQLDTIGLFNRLGADDQLRRDLVAKAMNTGQFDPTKVLDQGGAAQNGQTASPPAPAPNQPQQPAPSTQQASGTQEAAQLGYEQVRDNVRKLTRELDGIVALPASWQE